MAAPASVDDFLAVLAKSKLLAEEHFDQFTRSLRPATGEPGQLAEALIEAGLLTRFQADNLLKGRWLRYFIGPYKVLDRIGSGSAATVYLCEHARMRRRVAVKVLLGSKAQNEAALLRFEREARAAAALDHPNIVRALDLAREDRLHYLVMEYVDGISLRQLLGQGPLPPERVADYLGQAALGLHHAHEAGLIHRDVKPANLMLARNGVIKVLDLGLARFTDDEINLTCGAVLGSETYMAPEQAQDSHGVDARADVYSLGATFFHCLTGKRPQSDTLLAAPPRPPAGVNRPLFARLLKLLQAMMSPNPDDRPQTAGEVARALNSWKTPTTSETAVDRPTHQTETETALFLQSPSRSLGSPRHPDTDPARPEVPRQSAPEVFRPPVQGVKKPATQPAAGPTRPKVWLSAGIGTALLAVAALALYLTLGGRGRPAPRRPPLPSEPPTPQWAPKPVSPHAP
jgi:serine/threonine protein kinase